MEINEICICGGGSLGTVCAALFASQGYVVNLLTGRPFTWNKNIQASDPSGKIFKGKLNIISDHSAQSVTNSDLVLLCVPGFLIEDTLLQIKPYIKAETIVGSIVGNTGFFFKAHDLLPSTQPLFSFQRVPFIARYKEYGKSALLLGYKSLLKIATENLDKIDSKATFEKLFLTPVEFLKNYLEVSLSNSNPILHTGRLYSLWNNYNGKIYKKPILFYSEWDDPSSEIVLALDEEFITLRDKLNITSSSIPSLKEYYEVGNARELTDKITSIPAFSGISAPMKQIDGGFIPDFKSRYFTEDFPFGLSYILNLAKKEALNTPMIDKIFEWGITSINNDQ